MKVETLIERHPPERYQMSINDYQALRDYARRSCSDALIAAYNYGFINGQKAGQCSRRKTGNTGGADNEDSSFHP